MPIDVVNHLWVSVCGAAFVQLRAEYGSDYAGQSREERDELAMQEAKEIADALLVAYQNSNASENRRRRK